MYIPEQGDIATITFDPSEGKEITKRRPAIVLSRQLFNDHTGFAVVAPITSTVRSMAMEIELPDSMDTEGVILIYQFKCLDFHERDVDFVEKAPEYIVVESLKKAKLILS